MRASCLVVILVLLSAALAHAGDADFEARGFEKKEISVLKGLGVSSIEDITFVRTDDIMKVASMTVVAQRRLDEKVKAVTAVEIINKTDITGICDEMRNNRMNPDVQVAGAAALVKQIQKYKHSTYRIEMIAKAPEGAVFSLVRAMEIHFEIPEVVEHTCHGLNMLAFTDNTKSKIGQAGGVDAIIVALTRHGSNAKIMQHALRLLAKVVFNDNIKKALATEDNIRTILDIINNHQNVFGMLDEACMALWQITTPSQYCLHMAAQRGYLDAVETILNLGGQTALATKDIETGATALHTAALNGKQEVVKALLAYPGGEQLIYEIDKEHLATPLHMAAATGKLAIVGLLMEKGGDRAANAIEGHVSSASCLCTLPFV